MNFADLQPVYQALRGALMPAVSVDDVLIDTNGNWSTVTRTLKTQVFIDQAQGDEVHENAVLVTVSRTRLFADPTFIGSDVTKNEIQVLYSAPIPEVSPEGLWQVAAKGQHAISTLGWYLEEALSTSADNPDPAHHVVRMEYTRLPV